MNIIFYRYNSVCEPDFLDAFKKLGITVIEDNDGSNIKGDVEGKMLRLGNMIAEHRPMFVFSINFFPFVSMLCDRLKIPYVAETVDCPVFELYDRAILGAFNRIFLFDLKQYESLSAFSPDGVFYLPLGAPAQRATQLLGDTTDYKYDISFVGSMYKEKDPFLKASLSGELKEKLSRLISEQMSESSCGMDYIEENITDDDVEKIKESNKHFYSSDRSVINMDRFTVVHDYMSPHMAYLERVEILNAIASKTDYKMHLFTRSDTSDLNRKVRIHGGVSTLKEMPEVFRNSKINLNITMRSIETGIPQRVWDVLACRGFLITNDQPEIHEYFNVGEHLETYKSREELLDKINYYMTHDDERERIAKVGYEEVMEKHDILQRVISIVRTISQNY